MGLIQCQTKWQPGGLGFSAQARHHEFYMDAGAQSEDKGPSPKEMLLASICACSGIDVASILQKMRVDLQTCDVNAKTETTTNYPSIFTEVQLEYRITGAGISSEQALKAVRLSMTKYCGVSAMVAESVPMTYQVFLNEKHIGADKADFRGSAE